MTKMCSGNGSRKKSDELARHNLNGRQIRNTVKTARQLLKWQTSLRIIYSKLRAKLMRRARVSSELGIESFWLSDEESRIRY
jgi:hypothetical protein